jgi:hypothetical protein
MISYDSVDFIELFQMWVKPQRDADSAECLLMTLFGHQWIKFVVMHNDDVCSRSEYTAGQ